MSRVGSLLADFGWMRWAVLGLALFAASPARAALEGAEIGVSTAGHDQVNPALVELSDRRLWFVVWEDWRNLQSTNVDIYGRFIDADGNDCGPELRITGAYGNQTRPTVAYRDPFGGTGRILVAWQDSGTAADGANIRHRTLDLPAGNVDCAAVSTSWLGPERSVSYSPTIRWSPDGAIISRGETLLLRERPKLSYEPSRDTFWLVWIERRSLQQYISEACFLRHRSGARSTFSPLYTTWSIGDPQFIGYVGLNANTLVERNSQIDTPGADVVRNDDLSAVRRLSTSYTEMEEVYTYEYFTDIANVSVASDTTAPETIITWDGIAKKGTLTCTCTDITEEEGTNRADDRCDVGEPLGVTFLSEYRFAAAGEEGEEIGSHVYTLPVSRIALASMESVRVDALDNRSGHYPALGWDPLSGKFLSVWEDGRDGDQVKIYGQLLNSSGSRYGNNFIVSYSDSDGDDAQDANVAESRQTRPTVAFDTTNQRYFVAWQDGRNSRVSLENLDIYGQYVDFEGSLRGGNFPLAVAAGNQTTPALAYDGGSHQFLGVWKSNRPTSFSDIVGQRFSLGQPQLNLVKPDDTALVPPLFDFGVLSAGETATQTVKLVNGGDTRVTVDCVSPYPADPPYAYTFVVPEVLRQCNEGGTLELVPSSEYLLGVSYQPTAAGTAISEFAVVSDAGSPKIFLQGIATEDEGTSASIVVRPGAVDCGAIRSTETSSYNVVVSNNGNVDVTVTAVDAPTEGTPFVLSGVEAGSVIPAGEDLYVVVSCGGPAVASDAVAGTNYNSRFGLLFDAGVTEVRVVLSATLVADGSAIGGVTNPGELPDPRFGGVVSEWRVVDASPEGSREHVDPLYVEAAPDGSFHGRWGGYSFPIVYRPGVGWSWSFSNGVYHWFYIISHVEAGYVSGSWYYTVDGAGYRSPDSVTEAWLVP